MSPNNSLPSPPGRGAGGEGFTASIISHGQADLCSRLLSDLSRLAPPSLKQVILTCNILEAPPATEGLPFAVRITHNSHPQGFATNHNRAFEHVSTPLFTVMNPDLRLSADPFPAIQGVGVASPRILNPDGTEADFRRPLVTPAEVLRRRFSGHGTREPAQATDWLAGMFLAFRSRTYEALGGFDERFFLYCEDVDLCARVRLGGLRLAVAEGAQATHEARRASHRSLRPLRLHVSSLLRFWSSPTYRSYRELLRRERLQPA